jgi:hypothetical protein
MSRHFGGTLPVWSSTACVVYDADTGLVRHIHRVVTLEGGREPTQQENEARAMAMLEAKGRKTSKLRALHVAGDAIEAHRCYAVEPKTRQLIVKEKR